MLKKGYGRAVFKYDDSMITMTACFFSLQTHYCQNNDLLVSLLNPNSWSPTSHIHPLILSIKQKDLKAKILFKGPRT